jgi:hypothetical protein
VTRDTDVRRQFISTHLSPRLLGAESAFREALDVSENRDARKAHVLLDEIDIEISKLEEHPSAFFRRFPENAERQIERVKAKLDQVRAHLESAIYAMGIPDEEAAFADHVVTIDSKRSLHFKGRTEQLDAAFQQTSLTLEAQRSFTEEILSRALARPLKKRSYVIQAARKIWNKTANEVLRQMLSMFLTDLEVLNACDLSDSAEEYAKFLAAKAVRWCSKADLLTECLGRVTSNPETNDYNRVNALFLQGDRDVAFDSWCQWTKAHMRNSCLNLTGSSYIQYPGVVLVVFEDAFQAGAWSREIEGIIGPSASVSTASFAAVEFPTLDLTPAMPTLFDPKSSRSEIRLAESLSQDLRPLYASGQLSQRLGLPGIPEIRLATVLFSIGVKPKDAWQAAERLNEKKVLVVVCSANSSNLAPAFQAARQPNSIMKHVRFYGELIHSGSASRVPIAEESGC